MTQQYLLYLDYGRFIFDLGIVNCLGDVMFDDSKSHERYQQRHHHVLSRVFLPQYDACKSYVIPKKSFGPITDYLKSSMPTSHILLM